VKLWVGRCNYCGRVVLRNRALLSDRTRRCSYGTDPRYVVCGGTLHGVRGEERVALEAAWRLGGDKAHTRAAGGA
jgi:hypothetical protein